MYGRSALNEFLRNNNIEFRMRTKNFVFYGFDKFYQSIIIENEVKPILFSILLFSFW